MNKEERIYPSMVVRSQAEVIELLEKENEQLHESNNWYEETLTRVRKEKELYRDNWNELKESIKNEIERTNELIKEDSDVISINNIRKMLNEDRDCWLYKMQEIESRK